MSRANNQQGFDHVCTYPLNTHWPKWACAKRRDEVNQKYKKRRSLVGLVRTGVRNKND
jgi:hypothetical protein